MDTPIQTNAAKCYLLSLPAELRTCIYELVLSIRNDQDKAVPITRLDFCKSLNPSPTILSLLATCRQINSEAAGIFFNINDLQIHLEHLQKSSKKHAKFYKYPIGLLETITTPRLAGIHRLTISVGNASESVTVACKRIGASMPRLKTLSFIVHQRWYLFDDFMRFTTAEFKHYTLRSLLKVSSVERVVLILKKTTPRAAATVEEDQNTLRELAKELSDRWSKKTREPKILCWEFL